MACFGNHPLDELYINFHDVISRTDQTNTEKLVNICCWALFIDRKSRYIGLNTKGIASLFIFRLTYLKIPFQRFKLSSHYWCIKFGAFENSIYKAQTFVAALKISLWILVNRKCLHAGLSSALSCAALKILCRLVLALSKGSCVIKMYVKQ